jgi:acetylornithine/succinyldiaminopimelate/putrescine aminotransferase
MTKSEQIIELTNHYGAHNYVPLPIVIAEAKGVWVTDPEGNKYMDFLYHSPKLSLWKARDTKVTFSACSLSA